MYGRVPFFCCCGAPVGTYTLGRACLVLVVFALSTLEGRLVVKPALDAEAVVRGVGL